MKFSTLTAAALFAASTQAIAVAYAEAEANASPEAWCRFKGEGCWKAKRAAEADANPSPEAWCRFKGEGCWKVKRAADAFSDAITSSGGVKWSRAAEVSNHRGGAAYNAKRSIDELAALVASAFPDSDTLYETLALYDHFGPDANLTEIEAEEATGNSVQARDSEETKRWCLFKGEGCWKRDAAPWCRFKGEGCWKRAVPMTPREAEASPWCLFKGEGCWKRFEDDSTSAAVDKRDAAPAFCPFGGEAGAVCYASKRDFVEADKRSCEQPGEACSKARRAAEALIDAIETAEPTKRDVDVEARWCRFKGEGCWKRDSMDAIVARCNGPSGACTAARRDLAALHTAARSVIDSLDASVE